jgi:hypothetical protein
VGELYLHSFEKRYLGFFLSLLFSLAWLPGWAYQAEDSIIIVKDNFRHQLLGRYISVLEVKNKPSLAKVMRDSINFPFKSNYEETLQLKGKDAETAYWVSFKVKNETEQFKELLLEIDNPLLEEIEFFEVQDKIVAHYYTGNRLEFKTRPIKHRNIVFKLNLKAGEEKTFYGYLYNRGKNIRLPLKLFTPETFLESNYKTQLVLGFSNGVFLFAIFLGIFLYFYLQNLNFLYAIFYILSLWLFMLNNTGLAFQYFWASYPTLAQFGLYLLAELNAFFATCLIFRWLAETDDNKNLLGMVSFFVWFVAILFFLHSIFIYFDNNDLIYWIGNLPLIMMVLSNVGLWITMVYVVWTKADDSAGYFNLFVFGISFLGIIYFYFNNTSLNDNFYTGLTFNLGCLAMIVNLFLTLTREIQFFSSESELQRVLAIKELRAKRAEQAQMSKNTDEISLISKVKSKEQI